MTTYAQCDNCDKEYRTYPSALKRSTSGYHFCSHRCYLEKVKWVHARGEYVNCGSCGKEVWRAPRRLKRSKRHYCSMVCLGKARADNPSEHAPNWIGGRTMRSGYVAVQASYVPDEYHSMLRARKKNGGGNVLEHRLVMAQHLGRPLKDYEVVHHKNGIKNDNSIENLELHNQFDHAGISVLEHMEIARLKREIKRLESELKQLRKAPQ